MSQEHNISNLFGIGDNIKPIKQDGSNVLLSCGCGFNLNSPCGEIRIHVNNDVFLNLRGKPSILSDGWMSAIKEHEIVHKQESFIKEWLSAPNTRVVSKIELDERSSSMKEFLSRINASPFKKGDIIEPYQQVGEKVLLSCGCGFNRDNECHGIEIYVNNVFSNLKGAPSKLSDEWMTIIKQHQAQHECDLLFIDRLKERGTLGPFRLFKKGDTIVPYQQASEKVSLTCGCGFYRNHGCHVSEIHENNEVFSNLKGTPSKLSDGWMLAIKEHQEQHERDLLFKELQTKYEHNSSLLKELYQSPYKKGDTIKPLEQKGSNILLSCGCGFNLNTTCAENRIHVDNDVFHNLKGKPSILSDGWTKVIEEHQLIHERNLQIHDQLVANDNIIAQQKESNVLKIKKMSPNATLPTKGSQYAAGYDLYSAIDMAVPARKIDTAYSIRPDGLNYFKLSSGQALVPTDLAITVPYGTYGRIAPRSGLSVKNGIDVGAGVIDRDYTGNCGVVLFNHSSVDFIIKKGDRIAQLILEKIVPNPIIEEVDDLESTLRGDGGFGSTGKSK